MGSPTIEAALEAKDLQARIKALPSLHFGALVWTSMTNSVCSFAEECKTEEGECLFLITVYIIYFMQVNYGMYQNKLIEKFIDFKSNSRV